MIRIGLASNNYGDSLRLGYIDTLLNAYVDFSEDLEFEKIVKNAEMNIVEDDENIFLTIKDLSIKILDENGNLYPEIASINERIISSYSKKNGDFDFCFKIDKYGYRHTFKVDESDDGQEIQFAQSNNVIDYLNRVVKNENKFMYSFLLRKSYNLKNEGFLNLFEILKDKNINKLEGLIKRIGEEVFNSNINSRSFKISGNNKLHRSIELPKKALDFLKGENASLLTDLQILGEDDPNEIVFLIEYFENLKKIKGFKNGLAYKERFIAILTVIKSENISRMKKDANCNKVDLFKLIPYLIRQRMFFNNDISGSFSLPIREARTYRDYLNLSGGYELYPSVLDKAHDIANRNKQILNSKEVCKNFNNVVKDFEAYEWEDSKSEYVIVAPKEAKDFVREGELLHHCLANYVEFVANREEKIMFLRKKNNPNEPFVTFSFDDNFNYLEVTEIYNQEVKDTEILNSLKRWKKELLKKINVE